MTYKKCGIHRDLTDKDVESYGKFSESAINNRAQILRRTKGLSDAKKDKIVKLIDDTYIKCMEILSPENVDDILICASVLFTAWENKIEDYQINLGEKVDGWN